MKKIAIIIMMLVIPSFAFATTTTATIGGTLKVYENLSISGVIPMVWPAQYAGTLAGTIFTNTNQAPANGITGTNVSGKAGKFVVNGTGGTTFTPSLSAFTFTAGPGTYTAINAATTVKLCGITEPMSGAVECTATGSYTLANPGTAGQSMSLYVQGKIVGGGTLALTAGTYTGYTTVTVTY